MPTILSIPDSVHQVISSPKVQNCSCVEKWQRLRNFSVQSLQTIYPLIVLLSRVQNTSRGSEISILAAYDQKDAISDV